jgi:hypothetical protein
VSINIEEAGNPNRKTKDDKGPSAENEDSSQDRKKRISVTPTDPEKLKEVAEQLGLPKSKVYNMAFQTLLEDFGME